MALTKTSLISEKIARFAFAGTAGLTVLSLIGIVVFLFVNSVGAFQEIGFGEFFLNARWNPSAFRTPSWGILSLVMGTLSISLTALLISVPLGISIAIYLSEIASFRVKEIVKPAIEMLASIPSVALGLLGLLFLGPFIAKTFHLSNGLNGLSAALLVAIAALPTIASICEDALSSIPHKLREASLALGATPWVTIRKVVVPTAMKGIIAAIMLGLGRIIGETMIVLMVAGNSLAFPTSLLDPMRPMTANIAIEIKEVVVGSLHWKSLFAIGFILFIITFLINFLADTLIRGRGHHFNES